MTKVYSTVVYDKTRQSMTIASYLKWASTVAKLTKKYKKIKKYMKSNYYDLLQMHGTEKIVTNLLKEPEEDG